MKTEYLFCIDTKNGIAKTEKEFNYLLMSNANLRIKNNKIVFDGLSCDYRLQQTCKHDSDIALYHMIIETTSINCDFDHNDDSVKKYLDLLKNIRTTVLNFTNKLEILWDDVSFCLCQKAYPKIYEIENLFRKLLTKFMLINVGEQWEKNNIPTKISKSKNQSKEINVGNSLLYQLDFKEISTFLFDKYATKNNIEDLRKYIDTKDDRLFSEFDEYLPKSNWKRFFENVLTIEEKELKKLWEELYSLRCKIAHNNEFKIDDYERVEKLTNHLKPVVENAIAELDRIQVDEDDKIVISEIYDFSKDTLFRKNNYYSSIFRDVLNKICFFETEDHNENIHSFDKHISVYKHISEILSKYQNHADIDKNLIELHDNVRFLVCDDENDIDKEK